MLIDEIMLLLRTKGKSQIEEEATIDSTTTMPTAKEKKQRKFYINLSTNYAARGGITCYSHTVRETIRIY